ncbi:MAG TPA: hypothetical protein DIT52_02865 [Flavobacteriaceae bacterium]|mgnify:FL=1|nr:hypothetical protein [Flavobacteriaceae bacterium]|tara:strand:+ start:15997 stop:17907 length:1911 start_codon:yes stop_codon:yes gene_type:complete
MENQVNDPELEQNTEKGALEKQTEAVESQVQKDPVSTDTQLVDNKINSANLEELVEFLEKELKFEKWFESRNTIQKIIDQFEATFNTVLQDKKKEFLDDGGNSIDFFFKPPAKEKYDTLLREYRQKKRKHYQEVEQSQKVNQERKEQIIDEIKELIGKDDNINQLYNAFKNLQDSWYKSGPAPRAVNNSLWQTYKHHVERFYDFIHLNRELRAKDYEHNYNEKLKIIEKAEELAALSDVVKAGRDLDVLHRLWKEDLGPVAPENREELWKRFQAATHEIHKKKQEYYKNFESIQKENLAAKEVLIKEMKAISETSQETHNQWQKAINKLLELREQFKQIGPVPKSDSKRTWAEFRDVSKEFNQRKNTFYRELKNIQREHIKTAKILLEEVQSILNSENWREQSNRMKTIQKEWKNIGPIPKKLVIKLRKQFFDQCNLYFERLKSGYQKLNEEETPQYESRKEYLKTLESETAPNSFDAFLDFLDNHWKEWIEMDDLNEQIITPLNNEFQKIFNKKINSLDASIEEKNQIIFEIKIRCFKGNTNDLNDELMTIKARYEKVITEINQLENNLEFFNDKSESNPLFKEVNEKLDTLNSKAQGYRDQLTQLRQELRLIKNQEEANNTDKEEPTETDSSPS